MKTLSYHPHLAWFILVQILSIVSLIFNLGSLLLIIQNAAGIETKFCRLSNIPIIFLQSVFGKTYLHFNTLLCSGLFDGYYNNYELNVQRPDVVTLF